MSEASLTNDVGLGHVRIDEDFLGITAIRLAPGGMVITARRYGPAKAVSGPYRLFTADGEPVTDQAVGHVETADIPALSSGQVFNLTITVNFTHVDGAKMTIKP